MRALALLALASGALGLSWEEPGYTYDHWLAEGFGKKHPGSRAVFEANLARIRRHNSNPAHTWRMGVNEFTALTQKQFKHRQIGNGYNSALRTGLRARALAAAGVSEAPSYPGLLQPVSALPASVDWRTKSVVTAVKDQGMCGSCWSFSATETIESAVAIATGHLMVLSEQQMISCAANPLQCGGTGGCDGATQEIGFDYVATSGGLSLESSYPYKAATGTCDKSKIVPAATISNYTFLQPNNYTVLMNAVANLGPVAISVAAEPMQFYTSGVFSGDCGWDVDHAVQLVGYGHDSASGMDYYTVRNSWGASWGEDGYIRVARYGSTPSGEPCGTDTTPGDGDGCAGGPGSITVCGECAILSDSSIPLGAGLPQ